MSNAFLNLLLNNTLREHYLHNILDNILVENSMVTLIFFPNLPQGSRFLFVLSFTIELKGSFPGKNTQKVLAVSKISLYWFRSIEEILGTTH